MLALSALFVIMQATAPMIALPAGSYRPLYGRAGDPALHVDGFRLDRDPVTRGDYLAFVRTHQQWRRSAVRPLFANREGYLADWRGDLDAGDEAELSRPVSGVSWFAARAYCAARGARLPLAAEWEYAASADSTRRDAARDPRVVQGLVSLYATRVAPRPRASEADVNAFGLRGLHAIGWEWVADFNSILVSDDSRGIGARDHDLFCASAAIGAVDPSNFPAFLRYGVRAGLTGRSTLETLGFRCAA
jgi:sulfatase modifying factor 1